MFLLPLLLWKSNRYYLFWMCVRNLSYPACNARAPYCRRWPVRLYNIFSHYLINGTIFKEKSFWTQNACFGYLYSFIWNISHFKKKCGRWSQINMSVGLHVEYALFLSDFIEIWISSAHFRNILISDLMKIRPTRAEFHAGGRTDRQTYKTKR